MNAYQFETVIPSNGVITLPDIYKNVYNHRVRLTLVDLDESAVDAVQFFIQLTNRFAQLNEPDLDLTEIYSQRGIAHERNIVFD